LACSESELAALFQGIRNMEKVPQYI